MTEKSFTRKVGDAVRGIDSEGIVFAEPNEVKTKKPKYQEFSPDELYVEESYQRHLSAQSINLINRIVEDWSWNKYKPPVVSNVDGKYVVIDGQHTALAADAHPDIDKIPCLVIDVDDIKERAAAFVAHNTQRISVQTLSLFWAQAKTGDEEVGDIVRITRQAGIEIPRSAAVTYDPNIVVAIKSLLDIYRKHGAPTLAEVLRILAPAKLAPIRADHLKAVTALVADRDKTHGDISPSRLMDVIKSLNDIEARQIGAEIARATSVPLWKGLAQHYVNAYRRAYYAVADEKDTKDSLAHA